MLSLHRRGGYLISPGIRWHTKIGTLDGTDMEAERRGSFTIKIFDSGLNLKALMDSFHKSVILVGSY